jgi:DNA-binding transcriptional ArsR family regulator
MAVAVRIPFQARGVHSPPAIYKLIFGASNRRTILDQLSTGVYCVSELGAPFKMRQPSISKHLKVLENAGLVERGKDGQWHPRALDTAPLEEATAYLAKFRNMEDRLDRLELYLEKLQATQLATNDSR